MQKLPFSDFVDNHFRKNSKQREKRGVFSKDKIDNSLLELPELLSNTAAKTFSQILKYCQLRTTRTYDYRTLAQHVIQTMINNPLLRDEVYCQLMKQTILNPKKIANKKAWELIALATGCVTPTDVLLDYLIAYLQDSASLDTDYKQLARQAQARLASTLSLSTPIRSLGPTFYEISCIVNCVPIYCEVLTADDVVHSIYRLYIREKGEDENFDHTEISIGVNTSVRELTAKMSEKLRLPSHYLQGYRLYARVTDNNSLFQNNYTRLGTYSSLKLDQAALDIWRVLEDFYSGLQDKKQKELIVQTSGTPIPFKLLRKVMTGPTTVPENHVIAKLEACQGAKDLFSGKHPATPHEATNLAALYLQFTHGDYDPSKPLVEVKNVRSFVAPYIFNSSVLSAQQWAEALRKSAHDARVQFLRNLRDWPIYGCALFLVHVGDSPANTAFTATSEHLKIPSTSNAVSNSMWLTIHRSGIDILSYPDFKTLRSVPIRQIAGWSYSADCFNITVGSLRKPFRLFFFSPEAPEMDSTLRDYVELLTAALSNNNASANSPPTSKARTNSRLALSASKDRI